MADYTEEELARLKKLFDHIDTDKDGVIHASDIKALAHEFGREITDERAQELLSKADPSGSGNVDFASFSHALAVVLPKLRKVLMAIAVFKHIDKDGSGKLSKSELKQLVQEVKVEVPDDKIDELIAKVDTTGTGEISFRDFIAALIEFAKSRGAL